MPAMILTSVQNPRVKQVVKWRDRRDRDRDQKVLIEGYRALTRALAGNYPVEDVYFCPEWYQGEHESALLERLKDAGATLYQVAPTPFARMAYRDRPEGLLGVGPQRHRGLNDLPIRETPPFYLVAEQIEKPGNLGTMLRSADAAGVDGLILCDPRTDLYNPNVVRASTGNLFTMSIAEADSASAIAWLKERGIAILAASPHVETLYTAVDMTAGVAIVVGAEQFGLSEAWMQAADVSVRLPMMGEADSLNVATATTLLLYEALRQRLERGIVQDQGPQA
ncbi:MAG: RNA methyltransferase [Lentisphaerae bacterium]|jgi:TrmH family RNA methyltransferase|nr:RNA methyltransferase [Lentisphaerota bacterium]